MLKRFEPGLVGEGDGGLQHACAAQGFPARDLLFCHRP